MNKYSLIFALFSFSAFGAGVGSVFESDPFDLAGTPLASFESWSTVAQEARDYFSQTLKKVGFSVPELRGASKNILTSVKRIRRNIDVLQFEVERPDGAVAIIGNIVALVDQLQGQASSITHMKEASIVPSWFHFLLKSPSLLYKYNQLIGQIDNLNLNELLRPVQRIINAMREIFFSLLQIRSSTGTLLAPAIISDELVLAMQNLINTIDALNPKLTDIVVFGKRQLRTVGTQYDLLKHLLSNRQNLEKLTQELSLLEVEVPPRMSTFLAHLNLITQAADPLIQTIQNFNATLRERLAQKKKETGARIATPSMITEQTRDIFQSMRGNFNSIIGNAGITLGAIAGVVQISITNIIQGIKTQIDFDVLDPRAYTAAIEIPALVDELVAGVHQLQIALPK